MIIFACKKVNIMALIRKLIIIVVLALSTILVQAQSGNIVSGSVCDSEGVPIPGAGIRVQGTRYGTVTDLEGHFVVDIHSQTAFLEISALGYSTKVFSVGKSSTIDVVLEEESLTLGQVVVTGYGTGIT